MAKHSSLYEPTGIMVPNVFYFILFGNKEFNLFHYIAVRSALEINKPDKIVFICDSEPQSEWFLKIRPFIEIKNVTPPEHIFNNKLYHNAHKADVIRLEMLIQHGGIYLDLDTICLKPLHEFRNFDVVMGEEHVYWNENPEDPRIRYYIGLCNAVIIAKANSPFLLRWYDTYKTFRSKGSGHFWAEHSVEMPGKLSKEFPGEIKVLGENAFFNPSWDEEGLKSLFEDDVNFPGAYIHHLWERVAWDKYLAELTPEKIMNVGTTYNKQARKYLSDLI